MTFDEAIFCMKQYLPDSDSLECMKCPYYHTVSIEGTENGFTCKADEAHKMAIKALETIPKYKDAYGKGWDDGAKASYEHLKMCEEEQSGDLISRERAISLADELKDDLPDDKHLADMVLAHNEGILEYQTQLSLLPSVNPQEPKWIPVSEGLPEKGKQVLCCNKSGSVFTSAITYINSNGMIAFGQHYGVIAWMPLPKPYEPQKSENCN